MVLIEIAATTIKTAIKESVQEASKKSLNETTGNQLKESPIKNTLETIENSSLESLKAQNALTAERINEARAEQIEKNREAGVNREEIAGKELASEFPESEGYKIEREQYLRDEVGNITKDIDSGEARRIDFVVAKEGKVIKSVEVTSETAPKDAQIAKEVRIRNEGGNFFKDRDTGELIEFTNNVQTEIRRYL